MRDLFGRVSEPDDERDERLAPPAEPGLDDRGARWLRRHLAAGVVAVTTVVDGLYRASTVAACTSVSTEPPQFLISIELDSQMDEWLLRSGTFGLSILTWDQQFFADQFAGFAPLASSTFKGIDHFLSVTGAPLLADAIGWADCRIVATLETGDHRCFIGQAEALGAGRGSPERPLLYYRNRYRQVR